MEDPKLTWSDVEAILDAARYHADLLNALHEAYDRCDLNQTLILLRQLLGIKKESIQ